MLPEPCTCLAAGTAGDGGAGIEDALDPEKVSPEEMAHARKQVRAPLEEDALSPEAGPLWIASPHTGSLDQLLSGANASSCAVKVILDDPSLTAVQKVVKHQRWYPGSNFNGEPDVSASCWLKQLSD